MHRFPVLSSGKGSGLRISMVMAKIPVGIIVNNSLFHKNNKGEFVQ